MRKKIIQFLDNDYLFDELGRVFVPFFNDLFLISLFLYLFFTFLDELRPYFVSAYFDNSFFLIVAVISGSVLLISGKTKKDYVQEKQSKLGSLVLIFCLSLLGSLIILLKTKGFTPFSYVISSLLFLLFFLISLAVIREK